MTLDKSDRNKEGVDCKHEQRHGHRRVRMLSREKGGGIDQSSGGCRSRVKGRELWYVLYKVSKMARGG